jgi:hypothetical protein
MPNMPTLPPPAVKTADRLRMWRDELERWAALRGLPPEPWPLP